MTKHKINENDINKQSERLTPTMLLQEGNARLHSEIADLRKDYKVITEENKRLLIRIERLKSQRPTLIGADILLTVGSLGFGFLGVCDRNMFGKFSYVDWYSVLLGVTFITASIGLVFKYTQTIIRAVYKKLFSKNSIRGSDRNSTD